MSILPQEELFLNQIMSKLTKVQATLQMALPDQRLVVAVDLVVAVAEDLVAADLLVQLPLAELLAIF